MGPKGRAEPTCRNHMLEHREQGEEGAPGVDSEGLCIPGEGPETVSCRQEGAISSFHRQLLSASPVSGTGLDTQDALVSKTDTSSCPQAASMLVE